MSYDNSFIDSKFIKQISELKCGKTAGDDVVVVNHCFQIYFVGHFVFLQTDISKCQLTKLKWMIHRWQKHG